MWGNLQNMHRVVDAYGTFMKQKGVFFYLGKSEDLYRKNIKPDLRL